MSEKSDGLVKWLRDNASGAYRQCNYAADYIKDLERDLAEAREERKDAEEGLSSARETLIDTVADWHRFEDATKVEVFNLRQALGTIQRMAKSPQSLDYLKVETIAKQALDKQTPGGVD